MSTVRAKHNRMSRTGYQLNTGRFGLSLVGMGSHELAVVYAALILNDGGVAITGDKLRGVLAAAGVSADPAWVNIYADFFKLHDLGALLSSVSLGGGGGGPAAAAASAEAAPAETPKEEPKHEEEAVVELAGGFDDLFG
jgi:large subunit ribosomal protein LP1